MAINKVMVGESLVNDNDPTGTMAEIAHIDLLIGPRGSACLLYTSPSPRDS